MKLVVNVVVKVMLKLVVGMIEFKVFWGFCFKTDRQMDGQIFAIVESCHAIFCDIMSNQIVRLRQLQHYQF